MIIYVTVFDEKVEDDKQTMIWKGDKNDLKKGCEKEKMVFNNEALELRVEK